MSALAYHIIFSAYGFWLPNDPRGSGSTFVGSRRLYDEFGPATKVTSHESVAHEAHDWRKRLAAKQELKYPPTVFNGRQALEVGLAIRDLVGEHGVEVLACAVMTNHVHLVTLVHKLKPAQIVGYCRAKASRRLHEANLWPADRPVWGRGKWAIRLETDGDVLTRIRYVRRNPIDAKMPPQHWSFVTKYRRNDT